MSEFGDDYYINKIKTQNLNKAQISFIAEVARENRMKKLLIFIEEHRKKMK